MGIALYIQSIGNTNRTTMKEIWRDVVGYEGLYQVSSIGRARSLPRMTKKGIRGGKILKPWLSGSGYLMVWLYNNTGRQEFLVHRLVGTVFADMVGWAEDAKGRPFEELQINHKNEFEKTNNHISNLEWITREGNLKYGTRTERIAKALSKPVAQKTKDGELVKIWSSLHEIQRQTGWNCGNISACCSDKRKSAYGSIWEYINYPNKYQ